MPEPETDTNIEENDALSPDEENQKETSTENQAEEGLGAEVQEDEIDDADAEAAFLAGFNKVLIEGDEEAPENNEPKVDPAPTDPEPDAQTAAEETDEPKTDPAPAEDPAPAAPGVDAAAFADLQQLVRTNSGKLGELNSELMYTKALLKQYESGELSPRGAAQAQPSADVQNAKEALAKQREEIDAYLKSDEFKAMQEDYGESGKGFKVIGENMLALTDNISKTLGNTQTVDPQMEQLLQKQQRELNRLKADIAFKDYPDWSQTVQSPHFMNVWLPMQDQNVINAYNSDDVNGWFGMYQKYLDDTKPAESAPEKPKVDESRLKAAATNKPKSAPNRAPEQLSDEEMFIKGFNSVD